MKLIEDREIMSIHVDKVLEIAKVAKTNNYTDLSNKPTSLPPTSHSHNNVNSNNDGFMSKEDKSKLDNIKNFSQVSVKDKTNTTNLVPKNHADTIIIEAGDNIEIVTDVVNNKITISAKIPDLQDSVIGPKGDRGPKGDSGFTWLPELNDEGLLKWKKDTTGVLPSNINIKGPAGDKGAVGDKGPRGDKGAVGDKGPRGDKGAVGDRGPKGEQGIIGEQGPQGNKGPVGDKGPRGEQGEQGIIGEQGPQGNRGIKGDPYASFNEIQGRPIGQDGQAYYLNEMNDVKPGFILYEGQFVESPQELNEAITKPVNFEEIFNTWQRFSHDGTTNQPAKPSEITSWSYNPSLNKVESTVNSDTHIGFISHEKYDNYVHEVTLKSNNGDDDSIGVVIAFAVDSYGIEHTLTAVRSRSTNPTWFIVYDYRKSTSQYLRKVNPNINGDDVDGSIDNVPSTGWDKVPNGTRVRIERKGNIIKASASAFNQTAYNPSSLFELDLNNIAILHKFKGPCSYGYSCFSQHASTFESINFTGGIDNAIYDIKKNEAWTYKDSRWSKDSTRSLKGDLGSGKLLYNPDTKKMFFSKDGVGYTRIKLT